ncbi:MAG: bifunctional 2-polyprenyl-6-hydroxyphenol methylase/3-demethylubiquinol 3-O-methyltransferase UbiG [Pseudomonadota bacterium]
MAAETAARGNVDPAELKKFADVADAWWDPFGKFGPLHKLNPTRLGAIRDEACAHFQRDRYQKRPLEGLTLLDVGCGGGLVSEPMARLGATVTGLDAEPKNLAAARAHAAEGGLSIDYREGLLEDLVAAGEPQRDIVLALEIVEHVPDVEAFMAACAAMAKPGGLVVFSTINRTLKALALAKIGAEYILRWVPMGAHDPRKFVKPDELAAAARRAGLAPERPVGMTYAPLLDAWRLSDDVSVNYLLATPKPAPSLS